ncbi:MAG: cryptochrome/photolyase family protein [Bdellovibrio bacteriovorus]
MTGILWLRRDLRLTDNPALAEAAATCDQVLPLYIHSPEEGAPWAPGAASNWWLHRSLAALDQSLLGRGSRLVIERGGSLDTLVKVAQAVGATRVFWNRLYDPATRERDARIKVVLRERGLECQSHKSALLFEPWEVRTGAGEPYRVYSAFWRRCESALGDSAPLAAPAVLPPPPEYPGTDLADLSLLPRLPWDQGLIGRWQPGEAAALEQAQSFIAQGLASYGARRDLPAVTGTSRLSPHLHFGEIGPRQVITQIAEQHGDLRGPTAEPFVREILWREFAHHLLYHFPATPEQPLDPRFARLPWREDRDGILLRAWQRGQTGIPLVDAGMRELWHTGWMHNRVRMVVASFLTKNLRLPWQEGARWFWDTLVDADLASNTLGWQWSAGCGADAAPYFRIFNPVRQGERFDPEGAYVRRWCPELARLPTKYIHQPWTAPSSVLQGAGVGLGRDYPHPVVDLSRSRTEALQAFASVKAG